MLCQLTEVRWGEEGGMGLGGFWGAPEPLKKSRGGGPPPLFAKMPLRVIARKLVAWNNPEGCPVADQLL